MLATTTGRWSASASTAAWSFRSSLSSLVATGCSSWSIPKGFIPTEDTGQIVGFTEAAQNISFDGMVRHQQQVGGDLSAGPEHRLLHVPRRRRRERHAEHRGDVHHAQAAAERKLSAEEIIQELRPKLAGIPGIACSCRSRRSFGLAGS